MIEATYTNSKFVQWAYVFVFSFGLFLISCAPPPDSNKMVPYLDYSSFGTTGNSLQLSPVVGSKVKDTMKSTIDNESFYLALKETIVRTNLFREAKSPQDYDYRLDTKIISQKLEPGLTAFAALYVSYSLTNLRTGRVVWEENIFTQIDAFGANQGKDALEGVARANLDKLTDKLSLFFKTSK